MTKPKITNKDQEIVAEILNSFMFCKDINELTEQIKATAKIFNLDEDVYTGCYCSLKEAYENSVQYQKDLMIEKYGHCDGLE